MNYKFTIFTPCYNGANTIHSVFKSVNAQTYTNFEWIIIDDGSKDNSLDVIMNLTKKSKFKEKITIISQENKGKHNAWQKALELATGDLWIPADCDDSFVPETLAFFNEKASEIDILNTNISGINVCCYNPIDGSVIGNYFPKDGMISNNIELQYYYHIIGEHWGTQRVDLLRKFPFPQIKNSFYSENYLWYSFAINNYFVKCFNNKLRGYYYVPNSICNTTNSLHDKNRNYMVMHSTWWKIHKAGFMIIKYSPYSYFRLWISFIASIYRFLFLSKQ